MSSTEQEQVQEFIPATINVTCFDPFSEEPYTHDIEGWVYGDTSLGYYQDPEEKELYKPTHITTGMALGSDCLLLEQCKAFIREVATVLDWSKIDLEGPPEELIPALIEMKAKYL